jgi:hypothetical protein
MIITQFRIMRFISSRYYDHDMDDHISENFGYYAPKGHHHQRGAAPCERGSNKLKSSERATSKTNHGTKPNPCPTKSLFNITTEYTSLRHILNPWIDIWKASALSGLQSVRWPES